MSVKGFFEFLLQVGELLMVIAIGFLFAHTLAIGPLFWVACFFGGGIEGVLVNKRLKRRWWIPIPLFLIVAKAVTFIPFGGILWPAELQVVDIWVGTPLFLLMFFLLLVNTRKSKTYPL